MLPLLADVAATSDYVSGGIIVVVSGLIGWVLKSALPSLAKQYRDDVFGLQAKHETAQQLAQDKFTAAIVGLVDRFDKNLERLLKNGIEERKENRLNLEKELQKRDNTLDKVSEVLREIVNNVRILSEEVRTLKQLLPIADLLDPKIKEKLKLEN